MWATGIEAVPSLGKTLERYMLETISLSLHLQTGSAPSDYSVQAWTNMPTRLHSADTWYAIDIPYVQTTEHGHHQFTVALQSISPGDFELTYRMHHRDRPDVIQWLGHAYNNIHLQIAPPSGDMDWTQGPNHVEIMPGVYVGNFIAASQAAALGFDAVLNMAEELDVALPANGAIAYCKLGCRDGARYPISEEYIEAAIAWIDQQQAQGKRQILVHCRAGIGRSGSIGVAYCFRHRPNWSYQQTLNYVWSRKPDIYPHSQLQSSLEQLFPRHL
ncbi:MAG: dual specificity protein phosphatase [Cyanobacteria bacterium P01_C01_bin.120]